MEMAYLNPGYEREVGNTLYEMSNHLGNVLAIVYDRKTEGQGALICS